MSHVWGRADTQYVTWRAFLILLQRLGEQRGGSRGRNPVSGLRFLIRMAGIMQRTAVATCWTSHFYLTAQMLFRWKCRGRWKVKVAAVCEDQPSQGPEERPLLTPCYPGRISATRSVLLSFRGF